MSDPNCYRKRAIQLVDQGFQNFSGLSVHDLPDVPDITILIDAVEENLIDGVAEDVINRNLTAEINMELLEDLMFC
jgi:hypothetical protein